MTERSFTTEERVFLDEPAYARLATLMPDGAPQVTVMWYRRADDTLEMITPQDTQKVRNLDRDSRISVVIEDPESPHRYVEIRGMAEVLRDDAHARKQFLHIARRYVGERAEGVVAALPPEPRVLLVVHPEYLRAY